MSPIKPRDPKKAQILDAKQIQLTLERFCKAILKQHRGSQRLALIGIRTRGFYIAKRLAEILKKIQGNEIPVGELDIALYRDDLNTLLPTGKVGDTRIPFDIAGYTIVLVDDVLNTGRTIRAAVDHLMDLGRPKAIHLAVLIDRGGRELPIAADFVGKKLKLPRDGEVRVSLKEVDDRDEVKITR